MVDPEYELEVTEDYASIDFRPWDLKQTKRFVICRDDNALASYKRVMKLATLPISTLVDAELLKTLQRNVREIYQQAKPICGFTQQGPEVLFPKS